MVRRAERLAAQAAFNALLTRVGKANCEAEAKRPKPKKDEVAKEAEFLKRWSKGKPIRRIGAESTFWSCGKYSTKIDFKMADALVAAGFATIVGKSTDAGATLKMK